MMTLESQILEMRIYPVKSLGGISLSRSELDFRGLRYDRRYMLTDEHGKFITQREIPELSLFTTGIDGEYLSIRDTRLSDESAVSVPLYSSGGRRMKVNIWDDYLMGECISPEADDYFSDRLNRKCRLVFLPEDASRMPGKLATAPTSFTDGYPILLAGTASLEDLNSRLIDSGSDAISWDRFRPNIIVNTVKAFEEDSWKKINIGEMKLEGMKTCGRCMMTTIDQKHAIAGKEPLRTLASYRTFSGKVMFGMYFRSTADAGFLQIGDVLRILD